MPCSSLLPQLPSAEAGEGEAPWSPSMPHSYPQPPGLHDKSRWLHSLESKKSAGSILRAQ